MKRRETNTNAGKPPVKMRLLGLPFAEIINQLSSAEPPHEWSNWMSKMCNYVGSLIQSINPSENMEPTTSNLPHKKQGNGTKDLWALIVFLFYFGKGENNNLACNCLNYLCKWVSRNKDGRASAVVIFILFALRREVWRCWRKFAGRNLILWRLRWIENFGWSFILLIAERIRKWKIKVVSFLVLNGNDEIFFWICVL